MIVYCDTSFLNEDDVVESHDLLEFVEPTTGNHLVLFRSAPDPTAVDAFVKSLQRRDSEIAGSRPASQRPDNMSLSAGFFTIRSWLFSLTAAFGAAAPSTCECQQTTALTTGYERSKATSP
jgi:hypothetical protein